MHRVQRKGRGKGSTRFAHRLDETEVHEVSLDQVIRRTCLNGLEMQSRYKGTNDAGDAMNVVACRERKGDVVGRYCRRARQMRVFESS